MQSNIDSCKKVPLDAESDNINRDAEVSLPSPVGREVASDQNPVNCRANRIEVGVYESVHWTVKLNLKILKLNLKILERYLIIALPTYPE